MPNALDEFPRFLTELNGGDTVAQLTDALSAVRKAVRDYHKVASLTLKITVKPPKEGQTVDRVTITADVTTKLPRSESPADFFWLTDDRDASLSRTHPKQQSLELRQVPADDIPFREVSDGR